MENKTEKVVITSPMGGGKNYLFDKMVEKGLKPSVRYTTRKKTENENFGYKYFFVSNEEFEKLVEENKILVSHKFESNGEICYSGISMEEFENSQVFIMLPSEIKSLPQEVREKCFVVFLDIEPEIRRKRLIEIGYDESYLESVFENETPIYKINFDYDLKMRDPDFSVDDVYDLMV